MRRLVLLVVGLCGIVAAFSLTEPVKVVPRVDYNLGLVFLERWRGEHLVGIDRVITLEEYLDYQLQESVRERWKQRVGESREQERLSFDASGLIPDIELPKLPVFGEGSRIDISGQDRITLGGRQTVYEGGPTTPGSGGRLLPELKMEQQLAVRLNGTVGERTTVSIDHDSQRQESKNKIKLTYEGTDDEIVQSVELGDTRLSIPGSIYTGDLPAHSGLFGVSARGKLGGVNLYGVASREESQAQSQSFTGRRQAAVDTIFAGDYVPQRFYYIDAPGQLLNVRVYVDDNISSNNDASVEAIATVFPEQPESLPANWNWDRDGGDFDLKYIGTDFVLYPGNLIEFSRSLGSHDVVGIVAFTDQDTVGGSEYGDSLVLKLLKPERPDSLSLTWDYEMRNVYALPQTEVQLDSIQLYRDRPLGTEYETDGPNDGQLFSVLLGLDPNGDGRLEYPQFDSKTGLIRFPTAKPFASTELSVRDSLIYRKYPLESDEGQKYYLVARYSSSSESYSLGQTDIEEGSERVRVNGELWTRGTDYDIDYSTGVLTFLRALPSDADINVTFEYRPWFSLSQKSLVGTRAEWKFAENGKVGSSVFYRSEGVPDDKPVLGSEPFRRVIAETDASYSVRSDAVTAALDRLPLIRAQAASALSASAEGAISLPDPNTRGVAYLDDFESTTITRDLSNNAILWFHGSVPVGRDTQDFCQQPLFWTTPLDRIRKDSVFGPNIGDEGSDVQDFLRVVFHPDSGDIESWAGMMTSPSQFGMNLQDIENLEIIARSRHGSGSIHVTVGMSIDEDAPRRSRSGEIVGLNGRLDTEDRNGNGILDEGLEDTGLDSVYGTDSEWQPGSADDGNDDYDVTANPAGTENNRRLDSEDLDRSGFSLYNHYFECDIPLNDEDYASPLYNDWQLYRIPLQDTTVFKTVGTPKWEDIRLVRLWFDGFEQTDTIDLYSVQFVGSRWRNPQITCLGDSNSAPLPDTSEKAWVAQISKKTDTAYVPPFEPKKDAFGRVEQEASLLFGYRNMRQNCQAFVEKASAESDDYRDYKEMRIYVHDDGNDISFFTRLGADSVNYYEYRAPVTSGELVPGRDGKWYEFTIILDSFPVLKALRDTFGTPGKSWARGPHKVVGKPSLADIRYSGLGIQQTGSGSASGGVWFDDIRLAGPRRDPGYGFQARVAGNLSDFASGGVAFSYSDPNFRRFSEAGGVKTGGFATALNANLKANLDRLLPYSWGISVPLSYSVSRQQDVPKFSPAYPDLRLDQQPGAADAATARSENIGIDNLRKRQSGNAILNYTVEAMGFSWLQRRAVRRSALYRDSTWSRALAWSYGINPDWTVELNEDDELALLPQGIRFGVTDGQRHDFRRARQSVNDSFPEPAVLQGHGLNTDFGIDYSPLEDLDFEYGIDTERDLLVVPSDTTQSRLWFLGIGTEAQRDENLGASYSIDVGDFLTPSVEFGGEYWDERPKADSLYAGYQNMNNSGELGFGLSVDLPELLDLLEEEEPKKKDTSGTRSSVLGSLRRGVVKLSGFLDPVDVDYSIDRSSDLLGVWDRVPWHYRLGFTNSFPFDTTNPRPSVDQETDYSLGFSSGARVKQLSATFAYDWSQSRETYNYISTFDRSMSWPDLDLTLGDVHKLFPKLATDSKLTSSYQRRHGLSGEYVRFRDSLGNERESLGMYYRTRTKSDDFNPLLSWTTTWKKRLSTTVSANYTSSSARSYLSEKGDNWNETGTRRSGADLSLSYSFSAPRGVNIPLLSRLKFSSDLRLTWSLKYSSSSQARAEWVENVLVRTTPLQSDKSISTRLAGSYSFSRTIEAGSNFGYSYTGNELTNVRTKTTDLDFWVLFRF